MRRAKPEARVAGFSLIEAMAALALTATIVMALAAVTGQWLPNWRRGFVDLQRADLLGVGLERIVEDVSAAEYVTPRADAPTPLFEGDSTTVIFVRSAIGPNSHPHLEVVRLARGQGRSRLGAHAYARAVRASGAGNVGATLRLRRRRRSRSRAVPSFVRLRWAGPRLGG